MQTQLFLKQIDELILSFLHPKLQPAESLVTWPADFATSRLAVETGAMPYILKSASDKLTSWVAVTASARFESSWDGPVDVAATFPCNVPKPGFSFIHLDGTPPVYLWRQTYIHMNKLIT